MTAALTLAGFYSGATAARGGATLTLSPEHGIASASFAASYQLSAPCPPEAVLGAVVAFLWEGALIGQAPVADQTSCSAQAAALTPPQNRPDLITPGEHTVTAVVVGGIRVRPLTNTTARAKYTLDASTVPTGAPSDATPAPTAPPTPLPTVAPLLPITATFAPHNCENGIPDGPTACPAPVGGVLALGSSPTAPAALTPSSASASSSGTVLLAAGLLVAGVGMAAVVLAWRRTSGPPPRGPLTTRTAADFRVVSPSPVDQRSGHTPLRPSSPRRTPPPPPSAPPGSSAPPDWSRGRGPFN